MPLKQKLTIFHCPKYRTLHTEIYHDTEKTDDENFKTIFGDISKIKKLANFIIEAMKIRTSQTINRKNDLLCNYNDVTEEL